MKSLKEFLDNIEKKEGNVGFAGNEAIVRFKQRVHEFYECVEQNWLKELIDSKQVVCSKKEISVTEERLGTYSIEEMTLYLGRFVIRLIPIGTILIGSPGRVDMIYEGKSRMLVLVDKRIKSAAQQIVFKTYMGSTPIDKRDVSSRKPLPKPEYVWKFIDDPRQYTYSIVDKDSFQNLIVELING